MRGGKRQVLILIVLDVGLLDTLSNSLVLESTVLILIVLDVGLLESLPKTMGSYWMS